MSRIQQSISSAKKERGHRKGKVSSRDASANDIVSELKDDIALSNLNLKPGRFESLDLDHLEKNRIIHAGSPPDVVTPYKILRTRVLQEIERHGWRVLAVTAAHEGAGKTNTAINLALTVAQSAGHPVFLLDLDLRKPGIASSLGLGKIEGGLGDYLSNNLQLDEVLWNVGVENLVVVPGTLRYNNSSELLTSKRMTDLVSAIKTDPSDPIVIIDLPPLLLTDDALAIVPMVDSILFVVAEGQTKRADIVHSLELLKDVDLAGVVLNKSKDPQPGY